MQGKVRNLVLAAAFAGVDPRPRCTVSKMLARSEASRMHHVICAVVTLGMLTALSACHTIPDPNDPARQARIDDCLKQCGSAASPPQSNTAYAADPLEQRDARTPCEKRCYSIP